MLKKISKQKTIFFISLAIIFFIFITKLTGLLMLLFAAFVFAAALNPFVNKLEEKIKNRALSATIIVFTTIVSLVALILPIIILCYKEIMLLISIMPQKALTLHNFITNTTIYGKTISEIMPIGNIAGVTTDLAQNILNQSVNITLTVAQMIFIILALTMFIFYILVDKQYLRDKFLEFFPSNLKEKTCFILSNITSKVGNYVRAQALSMMTVGVMVTITLTIFRVDYPILLGLIAGICEIIPVLGPTIAVLAIIAIAFPLGWTKIAIIIVLFLAIQQISNYMIRPFLFGKFMKLHPINILVALFVSEQFLGIWGVILSPALAATVCVLIDELYLTPLKEESDKNNIE